MLHHRAAPARADGTSPSSHDDQHGTAIVAAAGLINACHLTGRDAERDEASSSTAPAPPPSPASNCSRRWACVAATTSSSATPRAWCYQRPHRGHEPVEIRLTPSATNARTLGAGDGGCGRCSFGLSVKRRADPGHGARDGRDKPIIFAMANPDPEITPEEARAGQSRTPSSPLAAATTPTRSTTCLGFPYIFRGALDVRASTINEAMKIAAAEALAASGA